MKSPTLLVFNAGSATLKFSLFDFQSLKPISSGLVERIGLSGSFLVIDGRRFNLKRVSHHTDALKQIVVHAPDAFQGVRLIGHRIVHGGELFRRPSVMTPARLKKLARLNQLAPLHNPVNVSVIRACFRLLPGLVNIGVFDTAYYQDLKPEVFLYSLPLKYYTRHHIRRYGFHGISHRYIAAATAARLRIPLARLNIISCHFGNGDSMTAIKNGKPIDTTMGFTPLEGLTMGTRSGDMDPAIPLYLIQALHMGPARVGELLNKQSGLLGISGFSSDMREILRASGHRVYQTQTTKKYTAGQRHRARLALAMFLYDVRRYLCAYAGLLGRVDAVVFTGGIGERSPVIRKLAMRGLFFPSKPKIVTLHTDEELEIAREARQVFSSR